MKAFDNRSSASNNNILIWDETLRDGEQMPGVIFSVSEKIEIVRALDKIGVDIIDIGFPLVSQEEYNAVEEISKIRNELSCDIGITMRAMCKDVLKCKNFNIDNYFLFSPTSDIHIKDKLAMTREDTLDMILRSVELAQKCNKNIVFISEDTARSDLNFLEILFANLYNNGVDKIILTDTLGLMEPIGFFHKINAIKNKSHKNIHFGVHCHNDFGLATANTISAIQGGVDFVTTTINGIGERSGNASLDEIILSIELLLGRKSNVKKECLNQISLLLEKLTGIPIHILKPITGYNAFRHESGIHVDGLIKNPKLYEAIDPALVGAKRQYVYGKHSGSKILKRANINEEKKTKLEKKFKDYIESRRHSRQTFINQYHSYLEDFFGWSEEALTDL